MTKTHQLHAGDVEDFVTIRARLFAAAISLIFLLGCATTQQPVAELRTETARLALAAPPPVAALPKYAESVERSRQEKSEAAKRAEPAMPGAERELAMTSSKRLAAKAKKNGGSAPGTGATRFLAAATASPEFSADADLLARRDAYRQQLKQASYTFNPPSPIKVATPVTVFFWIDPVAEPMRLAEELKAKLLEMRPGEPPRTEAGRIDWSPKMRATLTGDDFDITPTEGKGFDGQKNLSATLRTGWAWDIKAKHVGEMLPLHLRVWAVLPKELGEPYEVLKLDKLIHVEVTIFWLLDEFWEKYWKWILGGLGTALASAIGAWWKSRQPKAATS